MARGRRQRHRRGRFPALDRGPRASQQGPRALQQGPRALHGRAPASPGPAARWSALPLPPRWAARLPGLALLLLVALAYWPALFAGFVWDDNTFIVGDRQVSSLGGLWDIWFNPSVMAEFHYWPVIYSSFWLEHKLWGFEPMGFHATNLLLHGVNSLLVWRLLTRMQAPGAWLVAAIFAVHPVHVEAVAWVIARKDLLATFFCLLAFGAWMRYRAAPRRGRYLALLLLYAAGGLSKSIALTLPALLLLWAWWQTGRILRRDLAQTAPLFLLGAAIAAFDLNLFTAQAVHEFEYTFAERLVIAGKSLWFYAGKLLWPHPLAFMYPHWDTDPARLANWLGLAAALALALGLWLARQRIGRGALAGALFFAMTLAPVLGFADFGYMKFSFAADRYQYLPGLGLLMALVGGAVLACRRFAGGAGARYAAGGMAALALVVCGALSWQRTQVFHSEIGLFRHVVATNPAAPSAWFNLGTLLLEEAPEEAIQAFRAALEYHPDDVQIYINLGSALLRLERPAEAEAALRPALALEPRDFATEKAPNRARQLAAGVHYNLGNALLALTRVDEAEAFFRRALAVDPGNARAQEALMAALQKRGEAHFLAGRYAEALAVYRQGVALDPDHAEAHSNLGSALGQLGRLQEAVQSFERALALDPQMDTVRRNLRLARERLEASP